MIAINIARSIDEADRQASGENVIDTQMAEDRAQAEETAADMLEGGAGSMADTEY
jgi:large subunit ribosomal protein L9